MLEEGYVPRAPVRNHEVVMQDDHITPSPPLPPSREYGKLELPTAIQGARILLVEDDDIIQFVILNFLEESGMHVTVAGNGQDALATLQDHTFDVVLMDKEMPIMDGIEATRRIRQDSRFRDLPILATTASSLEQDRKVCLAAGMNDHIPKPFSPDILFKMLAKHIKLKP